MGYEEEDLEGWKCGRILGVGKGDIERSGIFLCENICGFNGRLA